jgi:hypothetical protein
MSDEPWKEIRIRGMPKRIGKVKFCNGLHALKL